MKSDEILNNLIKEFGKDIVMWCKGFSTFGSNPKGLGSSPSMITFI